VSVQVERKGTAALKIPKSVHCHYSANGTKHAFWGTDVPCHKTVYDTEENKKELILTLRRLMSYIYGAPILDVSRSHTTTQHSR